VRLNAEAATSLWYSTDEARTWERMENVVTGGTRPGLAFGLDGALVAWAYNGSRLKRAYRAIRGSALSAPADLLDDTAAAIVVSDDTASFALERTGSRRWLGVLMRSADAELSDWWSGDGAASVTRFA